MFFLGLRLDSALWLNSSMDLRVHSRASDWRIGSQRAFFCDHGFFLLKIHLRSLSSYDLFEHVCSVFLFAARSQTFLGAIPDVKPSGSPHLHGCL